MRVLACFVLTLVCASASAAENVDALLEKASAGLSRTFALEARFHQRADFAFMDVPLESSGKLCFSLTERQKIIFWEYREPERSGFRWVDGDVELWTGQDSRPASDAEKRFLNGMTDQILQWISFDPRRLKKRYHVSPGRMPLSLRFVPKEESALFSSIELTFSSDFSRIEELRFTGRQEDVTTIVFDAQRVNGELSEDCAR
ncbi:LolA family protein [Mailhella sp.]|uniref:LolA family protein n=1 Tax=Mailhella sp. TaxID=1981029 RepID=UPI003AB19A4A